MNQIRHFKLKVLPYYPDSIRNTLCLHMQMKAK